jgi:amino acid transporter
VLLWLSCLLASASVASALASSLGFIVPGASGPVGRAVVLALVYGAFAAANVRGVSLGTRVVETATVLKLARLLLLVGAGALWLEPADLLIRAASFREVGTAAITLIFAFVGVEIALIPSGEIRDHARTVPRAVFLALGLTTVLYLALQLVAHAVLGEELARSADAPLAAVASRVLGPWGGTLMLVGASVSMLGFLSGDVLGTSRNLFAFARDGLFPTWLAGIHPRHRTPARAIVAHAVTAWTLAALGTFNVLIVISNVAALSSYFVCCAAAIELSRRDVRMGGTPFRIPGGPLIPVLACGVILWLLSHATTRELVVTGLTVAVTALLYGLRHLRRRTPLPAAVPEPE